MRTDSKICMSSITSEQLNLILESRFCVTAQDILIDVMPTFLASTLQDGTSSIVPYIELLLMLFVGIV